MLAEERWGAILDIVEKQKSVTVDELTKICHTSESTVRRDLTTLAKMGRLNKVYGGATALDRQYISADQNILERSALHAEEKMSIAKYAATLITKDDFVYIDAGSTTDRLVDCIEETGASYMTNSLSHARKLAAKGCSVILPEGQLKYISDAIVGAQAVLSLEKYNFTLGFWGTNGVTVETGFTTPQMDEAMIKHVSMEHTKRRYVLCDSSKFSQISTITFSSFENAAVITDKIQDSDYLKYQNITEVAKK